MVSDYYFIGGCIAYIICVGVCAYCGSNIDIDNVRPNCLLCCSKEEKNDYSLINV